LRVAGGQGALDGAMIVLLHLQIGAAEDIRIDGPALGTGEITKPFRCSRTDRQSPWDTKAQIIADLPGSLFAKGTTNNFRTIFTGVSFFRQRIYLT
jgi:hypothetical protein